MELDEGRCLMTNIIGVPSNPEYLPLDMRLEVAFEERGDMVLPVFRPGGDGRAEGGCQSSNRTRRPA
ncbi:hypothetical protein [Streptomyces sviceus]|uniref:hypothetical protein n=1 Tax=Streptomyces sviceus TaxID=285530 RepID=UPI00367D8A5A